MDMLKKTQEFFDASVEKHADSLIALDWGSKRTQELRFFLFSEIDNLNGKTVLDVGCGFGDLFVFLTQKLHLNITYTGVDISKNIIATAKKRHPSLDLKQLNILEDPIESFDYVFGSGIHNIKTADNYALLEMLLTKMYEIANEGVATNMIDASFDTNLAEHIFAYEKNKVLEITQKITPYYVLRRDYLPHDFTLFLYKNDWATRNNYEA